MSSAAIVTLIGVFLLVGALAAYLFVIATLLKRVNFVLGTVLIGVRAIAHQTEPVNEVVTGIAEDITAIQQALEGVLTRAGQPGVERVPRPAVRNH